LGELSFSKTVVRASPNICFSQKWLFVSPRTFVFLKSGSSCLPERLFFSKTVVRASPNVCFSQKWLFQPVETEKGIPNEAYPFAFYNDETTFIR